MLAVEFPLLSCMILPIPFIFLIVDILLAKLELEICVIGSDIKETFSNLAPIIS